MTKSPLSHYTTRGSVRGSCGHRHETPESAERCRSRDAADCRKAGGYSDRGVLRVLDNGVTEALTDEEWSGLDELDVRPVR
jgi:hypothetical protein